MNLLYWLRPWECSPTVVVCLLSAAVLYWRGARHRKVAWFRQLAFWSGLVLLYASLHTRLDYYAEHEFFVHRIQHLLLHHLAPFLIALSYPGMALRAGLPLRWRRRWLRPALRSLPVRGLLAMLLHPLVAAVLFVGLIYFWLWPAVHFKAMLDARLYRVMNWSMVIDGLAFWWLVLDWRPRPPARLAPGTRILLALAVIPPQIVLGAAITFARHDIYPIYALCGRAFAFSALTDQYLGGLILWIPSAMMSVLAALIAMRHWLSLSARGRLRRVSRRAGSRA